MTSLPLVMLVLRMATRQLTSPRSTSRSVFGLHIVGKDSIVSFCVFQSKISVVPLVPANSSLGTASSILLHSALAALLLSVSLSQRTGPTSVPDHLPWKSFHTLACIAGKTTPERTCAMEDGSGMSCRSIHLKVCLQLASCDRAHLVCISKEEKNLARYTETLCNARKCLSDRS